MRIVEKPWSRSDVPVGFGDLAGRRVDEIGFEDPAGDDAPLVVKFLFTSERLSIQVHPDDEAARQAGFPRGKDECWLILAADAGAELGIGLRQSSDADTLRRAALEGSIKAMLDWRPSRAGDFLYTPAGTIHAIGPGLTRLAVHQTSEEHT